MDQGEAGETEMLIAHTTDIVVSYVSNNSMAADEVSSLIQSVYAALSNLRRDVALIVETPKAAVSIRSSVKKDHIVCLEDGKKMKMLKRHLMTDHGMTPDEYRVRWSLPTDYPMVAPDYAETRRALAMKFGLGSKSGPGHGRRKKST
ncbi:MucR family transcriptional regulator [Tsuneonella sp. HG222]